MTYTSHHSKACTRGSISRPSASPWFYCSVHWRIRLQHSVHPINQAGAIQERGDREGSSWESGSWEERGSRVTREQVQEYGGQEGARIPRVKLVLQASLVKKIDCFVADFGSESWSMLMSFSVWSHCQCWCLSQTIADQRKHPRVQMNLPKSRNNCDLILLNPCLKNCIAHELHSSSCFDATLCEVEYFGCKQNRSFSSIVCGSFCLSVIDWSSRQCFAAKTTSTQQPIPRAALFSCDFSRMPPPPALNAH